MVSGLEVVLVGVICREGGGGGGGGGREVQRGAGATEEGGGVKVSVSEGGPGCRGILQSEEEEKEER